MIADGRNLRRRLHRILQLFGIDLCRTWAASAALPRYWSDLRRFKCMLQQGRGGFAITKLYPLLSDRNEESGGGLTHYFVQDLYVASRVFQNNPKHHVDVGSRVDGFVAHVACFREVEVFDVRPLAPLPFPIKFTQADLTSPDFRLVDYCDSASCLHALEHFGLGRYGDPLDPDGHVKGLRNLRRLLTTDGTLYLSAPIGPQRIEFNAHRVFSVAYLLKLFNGQFDVVRFSLVDDSGNFHPSLELHQSLIANDLGAASAVEFSS